MRRVLTFFAAILIAVFAFAAQDEPKAEQMTLQGTLRQVVAIGGETSGWAIDVAKPLQKKVGFKRIEIEPADAIKGQLKDLVDKEVNVSGKLAWREGVERGRYRVLVVDTISRMEKMPVSSSKPKKDQ